MSQLEYQDLTQILRAYPGVVTPQLAVRVGSRVYGTAQASSDTDFAVVGLQGKSSDLLFGRDYNVTLFSYEKMLKALDEQNIFALEVLFAPAEHRLYDSGQRRLPGD